MNVHTIEQYLRFKFQTINSPLLEAGSTNPVKDIFGNGVLAEGGWKNPKKEHTYSAALRALHEANDRECKDYNYENRTGDPTQNKIFKNCKRLIHRERRHYQEKGSSQLLPADLRMLRG